MIKLLIVWTHVVFVLIKMWHVLIDVANFFSLLKKLPIDVAFIYLLKTNINVN
jgi:hypothetical protein